MNPPFWQTRFPVGELGLDENLFVRGADGRVLCCVCLLATVYIGEGDRPEIREGILNAYERYVKVAGHPLRWGADPETGDPVALASKASLADVRRWPYQVIDRFDFQMLFTGGARVDDAASVSFRAVSRARDPGQLSFVSFCLPLAWGLERAGDEFSRLVTEVCNLVHPTHGYAGLGVVPHVTGFDTDSVRPLYALASRFPGLELDLPDQHEPWLASRQRIKGIGWLTVLGRRWIEKLGGEQALARKLDSSIIWHRYADGVILQAGPAPALDDADAQLSLAPYRKVGRALAPIVLGDPAAMQASSGGFDLEQARRWLARFL
jgi:Protein of unknown function (DUF3396)